MKPFVDRHREELIRRVTVVDPILDDIKDLLTTEHYEYIRSRPTSQEKMEALFGYVSVWSDGDKEIMYNSLKKHNRLIIRDLEEKEEVPPVPGWVRDTITPEELEDTLLEIDPMEDEVRHPMKRWVPERSSGRASDLSDEEKRPKRWGSRRPDTISSGEEKLTLKNPDKEKDGDLLSQVDCHLCGKVQNSGEELIPDSIMDTYRLTLTTAGLFWCQETGIKFQVTGPVVIDYRLESWSDYLKKIVGDKYEAIGPLFNIKTDQPQMVSAVYLPHYLCVTGFTGDLAWIKCAHFKDDNMTLETPTRIEPYYMIIENPDFSCLGLLLSIVKKKTPIHGIVLLYFQIICQGEPEYQEYIIHLYLLPSTVHAGETLNKMKAKSGFRRIEKPAQTIRTVYMKKNYLIIGKPEADVVPKILQFKASENPNVCTEISIKGDDIDIELYVTEEDNKEKVWFAKLTKGYVRHIARLVSVPTDDEGDIKHLSRSVDQLKDKEGASSPPEHFVDKHRKALIERLSHVDPVLDDLLAHSLLTQEQYDNIRRREPQQEKMRQLYQYTTSWGNPDKEKLYQAILRCNKPLIIDLEGL